MFGKFAALALLASAAVAAPASAQTTTTFDAFSSFNATQGVSHFTYGTFNTATQAFSAFTQNTGCVIAGTICLRGATDSLPGVFKSNGTRSTDGTVVIPNDRLIVHPGQGNNAFYAAFTAPVAGSYTYSAIFNQQDSNTARHSVFVTEFGPDGTNPTAFFPITTVDSNLPVLPTGFTLDLKAGDVIGYIVDNNGNYEYDSTGFNFSVVTSAVPEPSTWAMMIVGFGVVGGSLRRRKSTTLATA